MSFENSEIEHIKAENPLLSRINKIPGTTIRLPSRGLFYQNGELDSECIEGEVTVFPMTTTDEIMMRSVDMLFQGTAIDSVIRRCIPQIKKPLELLMQDIDYILTQLRKISYGSRIPIQYACDCGDEEENKKRQQAGTNEYLIPVEHFIQNTKELEPKNFNKSFKVKLTNGQVVVLQPIRFSDYIKLQQLQDPEKLNDEESLREFVSSNFTAVTQSVDEIQNKEMIKEWYDRLPRYDTEIIKNKLDSMEEWGTEFKYTITCRHCQQTKTLTTQLNPVYFFTLPSRPETES